MLENLARRFHVLVEPIAATIYFAPEATEEYAKLGLDPTQGYFASRAAAMGRVASDVVAASFYSFHPSRVRANLQWDLAEPQSVLEARFRAAGATILRLTSDEVPEDLAMPVALLRKAVEAADVSGRPLAAAHAALPWPEDDATALWHAATVLREHRGDGHIAVLLSHGISPAEALTLDGAFNAHKSQRYFEARQFPEADWERASHRLRERGYLDDKGHFTDGGGKFREMIEIETDRLAHQPYTVLTEQERDQLTEALSPIVRKICERRGVPKFVAALAGYLPEKD